MSMSAAAGRAMPASGAGAQAQAAPRLPDSAAVLLALCVAVSLGAAKLAAVWQTGAFFDSDDAMRLAQVRDWLAGQAWYDLSAHRLLAPDGVFMHWSRVIDVPVGGLIRLFSLFAAPETAERLTRLVFPLLCMAALLASVIRLARSLCPAARPLAPALLAATSGILLAQFAPGRIDHHAPQICLLTLFASETIRALDGRHAASAAIAAALATLSLSISIENLPFVAVLAAVLGLAWIATGKAMDTAVASAGLAWCVGAPLLFAATVGPARYGVPSCDAFSAFHLAALAAGGAGLAALGFIGSARLGSAALRLGAAGLAGCAALAAAAAVAPACFGDPLGAVDPFLREHWLKDVQEARPLLAVLGKTPGMFAPLVLASLLGAAAIVLACVRTRGMERARWLALAAFTGIGVLLAFWQVRALSSLAPLALIGGVYAAREIWRLAQPRLSAQAAGAAAFAMGLPFCSLFWAAALPAAEARQGDPAAKAACLANASYAGLGALGSKTALAPVDLGAHLLANTHLRLIAAPYHRNNTGNRAAVEFFLGAPAEAHAIARAMKTNYLVVCPAMTELAIYAAEAPAGMAALLAQGAAPDWLTQSSGKGAALSVYKID